MSLNVPAFPKLPPAQSLTNDQAYNLVKKDWDLARNLLRQEDCDPVRLLSAATRLDGHDELLSALVQSVNSNTWSTRVAEAMAHLTHALRDVAHSKTTV